jgi:MFS family permease
MKKTRSPLYVTTLIAGAFFMENLDGTIIATALPQMARSFHIGAVNLNIGMTAYLLTLAVFIPISGWVADRFGARSIFASAIAVFTLASLLCGASRTLTQFTLMRILQGIGGAMMVPVGRLIVLRNTPKEKLTQAIAYITWPDRSRHWTSPGRLHHHLRNLALDLLPQPSHRRSRPHLSAALDRKRQH